MKPMYSFFYLLLVIPLALAHPVASPDDVGARKIDIQGAQENTSHKSETDGRSGYN